MLSAKWRPLPSSSSVVFKRFHASAVTAPVQDYYHTLGVDRTASAKEIKAAYYELSKKYHPDRHTEEEQAWAAQKFQEVATAYEVLGSDLKRRAYDATHTKVWPNMNAGQVYRNNGSIKKQKEYTDLDIDYKSFEQFQKSTRRRRARHSHFDMPEEFYAEFGGRIFTSQYKHIEREPQYKDGRAAEREREERRILREIEEERKKSAHPIPTFEQLYRQQQERKANEEKKYSAAAMLCAAVVVAAMLICK